MPWEFHGMHQGIHQEERNSSYSASAEGGGLRRPIMGLLETGARQRITPMTPRATNSCTPFLPVDSPAGPPRCTCAGTQPSPQTLTVTRRTHPFVQWYHTNSQPPPVRTHTPELKDSPDDTRCRRSRAGHRSCALGTGPAWRPVSASGPQWPALGLPTPTARVGREHQAAAAW